MAVNPDFRDLFAALNDVSAKYLLVGGYAVAFHGQPRFTKDLDLWVEASEENARRVYAALQAFGAPLQSLTKVNLAQPDTIFQIGIAPNRIDVITSIDGVAFAQAWAVRELSSYGDQSIYVIGRDHLIQNKRASGRPQDLLDVNLLEKKK
jgi:hypothetical protein